MVVSKLERNNRNAKGHKRKSTVGGIAVAAAAAQIFDVNTGWVVTY